MIGLSICAILLSVALVHSAPPSLPPVHSNRHHSHDFLHDDEPGFGLAAADAMWKDMEENFSKLHKAFDDIQKKMGEGMLKPFNNDFDLKIDLMNTDPKEIENKTISDEKVVDDHVIKTQEKVFSTGNSVVHVKQVIVRPKNYNSTDLSFNGTDTVNGLPSFIRGFKNFFHRKDSSSSTPSNTDAPVFNKDRDVEEIEAIPSTKPTYSEIRNDAIYDVSNELTDVFETSPLPRPTEIDLSGDTNVNIVAENHIRQPEPDAELIDSNKLNSNSYSDQNINSRPFYKVQILN